MSGLTMPISQRDHILGGENASVTLLEYGDYECPYCGEAYSVVNRIIREMGNDLRFVFRNFPLTESHPHALHAAMAAESAALQGKFWDMHHILYEHQERLDDEDLLSYAEQLGLDALQFTRDFGSRPIEQRVREDFMSGVRSGVNGTPTFFINGTRHDGPFDYDYLRAAIENSRRVTV
jgi:protein-disulfide isomerase